MAMTAQDLPDLLETTRIKTKKANFTLLDKRRSEFVVYPKMLRQSLVKWAGGHTYEYKVMTKIPDSAKVTGYWDTDTVKRQNVWAKGRVGMTHLTTNWVYDELERLTNQGEDQIVDEIEGLKFGAMMSLAEKMETIFPVGPADSSDDKTPYGLATWFTTITSGTGGFDQSNVPGFAAGRGGLDSTNVKYTGHANWADYFSNYTDDDLIEKLIRGSEKTKFKLPISNANVVNPSQANLTWYCNLNSKMGLWKATKQQNDQVGPDLGQYYDTFLVRGAPVQYLPVLDEQASEIIYGVNHGSFRSLSLNGNFLRESKGVIQDNHNARVFHIDLSWQTFCDDLSRNMTFIKV